MVAIWRSFIDLIYYTKIERDYFGVDGDFYYSCREQKRNDVFTVRSFCSIAERFGRRRERNYFYENFFTHYCKNELKSTNSFIFRWCIQFLRGMIDLQENKIRFYYKGERILPRDLIDLLIESHNEEMRQCKKETDRVLRKKTYDCKYGPKQIIESFLDFSEIEITPPPESFFALK